jgi:hypothetical protein
MNAVPVCIANIRRIFSILSSSTNATENLIIHRSTALTPSYAFGRERQSPQERRQPQPERQKPPTRSRSRTEAYRIVDSFQDAPLVFSKSDLDPALATVADL